MQTDTEHQENDADFCELAREIGVPDESRGKWAERYACKKVANDGGRRSLCATRPPINASINPIVIVAMSATSCGMSSPDGKVCRCGLTCYRDTLGGRTNPQCPGLHHRTQA